MLTEVRRQFDFGFVVSEAALGHPHVQQTEDSTGNAGKEQGALAQQTGAVRAVDWGRHFHAGALGNQFG